MGKVYDLIIIGAGPAGLTAGLYASRAKVDTLILEKEDTIGGQIKITNEVTNYPGIVHISGADLSEEMRKQCQNFGVKFQTCDVISVDFSDNIKRIKTTNGDFEAIGVIIATGAKPRTLGFSGEQEFTGRGVGYCATCDGEFFTGMDVFVIGAGFAAAEEAIFLTRFARKVTIIAREPEFTCAKTIADEVLKNNKIQVHFNTEVVSISGEKVLKKAIFINNITSEKWEYNVQEPDISFGVFVFVGYKPISDVFKNIVNMDSYGYVLTEDDLQTNIKGVFAAGDIRPKQLRQLVTAVSDGAIASTNIEKYIKHKKEELGIENEKVSISEGFFSDELKQQLIPILEKFEHEISIISILDTENSASEEVKSFLNDFDKISSKVIVNIFNKGENLEKEKQISANYYPVIAILDKTGKYTGIKFHGVPSGHEINSFVIALYNTAGPGQKIENDILDKINKINRKTNIKVAVSLSCQVCPEIVMLTQLMAINNHNIEAEMFDISKFIELRNKYNIMSVPAIIINDNEDDVLFGKKTLDELISYC
jgi:thioredoxin reductase (NADPH)